MNRTLKSHAEALAIYVYWGFYWQPIQDAAALLAEMGDAEPGAVRRVIGEHGIQFGLADDAVVIEIAGGKGTTKALNRLKS